MADAPLPAARGFSMPAEWEPHAATWLTWPHNPKDWPGKFPPIPWVCGEIVRHLSRSELVRILVRDEAQAARAQRVLQRCGADLLNVEFLEIPTDRGWNRDCGPIFLRDRRGKTAVAAFRFTGWAKYSNYKLDAKVPALAARALGLPLLPVKVGGRDLVLEGGSFDVNGAGAVLTTEECLLDPAVQVRNPGLSRKDYEAALKGALGVKQVIWLGKGIVGDDTHGHVDDLCRFVNETTAVLCVEEDPAEDNYAALCENRERLRGVKLAGGARLDVVALPMPAPLYFDGQRLPASYANFYVANEVVLVPTFNDPADRFALGILGELFPTRTVVGIHAVDLVWGLGTLHCLTQQQPL